MRTRLNAPSAPRRSSSSRRRVAGTPGYGLAFGGAAHMCFGLPAIPGTDGIGTHVCILRALFEAGLQRAPARQAQLRPDTYSGEFGSYPVVLRVGERV